MAGCEEDDDSRLKIPQLLHPELLPADRLISLLQERGVNVSAAHAADKEHLVSIVHRVAVPLPQRDCFSKGPRQTFRFESKGVVVDSKRDPNPGNKRLSDCIDYNKKKIKLRKNSDTQEPEVKLGSSNVTTLRRSASTMEGANEAANKSAADSDSAAEPAKKQRIPISWP